MVCEMRFKFNRYIYYFIAVSILIIEIISFSNLRIAIAFPTPSQQTQLTSINAPNKIYSLSSNWQFIPEASRLNRRRSISNPKRPLKLKAVEKLPKLPQQQWQDIPSPC